MIYQSGCWSVELPGTWRGESPGDFSLFEAKPSLGVLMIMVREQGVILADQDLIDMAYQTVAPDVRLAPISLGLLSGFAATYEKDQLSWQVWWLRQGSVLVNISYNAYCETASSGQDAVMAIINSLRIDGIDDEMEFIDKNDDLKFVLEEHGLQSMVIENWVFPYGKLPGLRSLWYPEMTPRVGQLDIQVLCEKDVIIAESFAGGGEGDARYNDAFGKFLINSLHVFLAAFWDKDLEQITKKIWNINGREYTAFIGQFGMMHSGDMSGLIPETAFNEIEKAIKREKLTKPLHWIRTYVSNYDGKYVFESLLDNEIWPSGESVIKKIPWKKSDDFYSVRNFLILKQTGPYKWWRKFK